MGDDDYSLVLRGVFKVYVVMTYMAQILKSLEPEVLVANGILI